MQPSQLFGVLFQAVGMRGAQCTKCGAASAQLISDTGRLCAECLQSSIRAKLNKAIKVYFALEHGDAALVAVSGGASSMALAHMLRSFSLSDWSRPQAGKVRASSALVSSVAYLHMYCGVL